MTKPFEVVSELSAVEEWKPTFLAVGVFDGVHRGHQELLASMVREARKSGARAVAMTFHPHPRSVIPGQHAPSYLGTVDDRVELLGEQGLDLIVIQPFNEETRRTRAADFVDRLCQHLDLQQLWGTNFGLGYKREGDFQFLTELGRSKGFTVHQYESYLEWQGQPISSSLVRQALREGRPQDAAALLGRSYRMRGKVVHGDGRGTQIGVPTANLAVWEEQVVPLSGVYAAYAWLGDRRYPAATNVGIRPTVNSRKLVIEAHLIGFEGDIYGQELTLEFESRIRDEQKFPGIDSLVAQIKADIAQVQKRLHPSHPA